MIDSIDPVLLAGGSGTRLWPLSRKTYPKQFSQLIGPKSLFQLSAERLKSSSLVTFSEQISVTSEDYRFIITEQLQEVGINPGPILLEPEAKNTAAAILAATIFAYSKNKEAILLVAPSDHVIEDTIKFHEAVKAGVTQVRAGQIVTFGIEPTRPETGYGYIEIMGSSIDDYGTSEVVNFLEKPSFSNAKQLLAKGNVLWNSGIFLFKAVDMIDAYAKYNAITLRLVSEAIENAVSDLGFLRLAKNPWSSLEAISIDHAIMEKIDNLVCVPYGSAWSDLGDWDAIWLESEKDKSGNVTTETTHAIECVNTLLRSESIEQQMVGIGLDGIIAVAMPDAVLVADKTRVQDVKLAVEMLKSKNIMQSEIYPKDYRPWGWFESLVIGDQFQVKRICVKPNASLSLQSHKHRSEHWVVVSGSAKVTVEDDLKVLRSGYSVYVPQGARHRLENPGESDIILIEIQIGSYLGEDDIIRYEDLYKRK